MASANLHIGKVSTKGFAQAYIRVIHKSKQQKSRAVDVRLYVQIEAKYFDFKRMQCKPGHLNFHETNVLMSDKVKLAKTVIIGPEIIHLTPEELADKVLRVISGGGSDMSFKEVIDEMRKAMLATDREGTAGIYNSAYNRLTAFLGRDPLLSEVTFKLLNDMKTDYLSRGRSISTVSTYMKIYNAAINYAVNAGYIDQNKAQRRGLAPGWAEGKDRALGVEVIRKLVKAREGLQGDQRIAVNHVLLQFYLQGTDNIDLRYMRKSAIENGYIRFVTRRKNRSKTAIPVCIKITPESQAIINECPGDLFVEDISLYKVSKALKEVCISLGLPVFGVKPIRHTYATIAMELGIPEPVREVAMGHRQKSQQAAYAKIKQSDVDAANAKVCQLLK